MRSGFLESLCLGMLTTFLGRGAINAFATAGRAAGEPEDRLAPIIAALRSEESKYRQLEYLIRTTSRKVGAQPETVPETITAEETRHVVLQGDRIFYRGSSEDQGIGTPFRRELVSAFDSETTRTVIAGNCVNVHAGRFEHPEVVPAHCVPLLHYQLNFPLSVYLSGTEAIHAHPKYGRFPVDGGGTSCFMKVVARYEGEEMVDGLRCLRICCNRWYSSRDRPIVQYLWLAPERNFHCVKEVLSWPGSEFGDLPLHQMHVEKLREVAPGRWFPIKITLEEFDRESLRQKKQVIEHRQTTLTARITLEPGHDPDFFRDLLIPADLPSFTVKDGKMVGLSEPQPVAGPEGEAKLKEVVAKVAENEARYSQLEVAAHSSYKHLEKAFGPLILEQRFDERSVLQGNLAYWSRRGVFSAVGQKSGEEFWVEAFDGRWIRSYFGTKTEGEDEQSYASLRDRGDGKAEDCVGAVHVHRPHTLLLRPDRGIYGSFADFLVSPWYDKRNGYSQEFRYCGQQEFEGHPCILLRWEVSGRHKERPTNPMVLWLATDRNDIPIRLEHYAQAKDHEPVLTAIGTCSDFRELAPGLWFPFHATKLATNGLSMMQGLVTLTLRHDIQITAVKTAARPEESLFREVVVPEGIQVGLFDRQNKLVRQLVQEKEGNMEATQEP